MVQKNVKFANAQQAKQIYQYKNIKIVYKLMQRYGVIKHAGKEN